MGVPKIKDFRDEIFTLFVICLLPVGCENGWPSGFSAELLWFCRKALPGVQRGPYGFATGLPLHGESGSAVTPGEPYGRKKVVFLYIFQGHKLWEIFVPERPGGSCGLLKVWKMCFFSGRLCVRLFQLRPRGCRDLSGREVFVEVIL